MFNIGALVKYDGIGVPHMARVEGYQGRWVRIAVLPNGPHLPVPPGDLALPGEDEAYATRERSALQWQSRGAAPGADGVIRRTDGSGNYLTVPETGAVDEPAET